MAPCSRRLLSLVVLAACLAPLAAQTPDAKDVLVVATGQEPVRAGVRRAVVVGIGRYDHLEELAFAEKDAVAVAAALTAMDFAVTTMLRDMDKSPQPAVAIRDEIAAMCERAEPDDSVLVFLSGHGFSAADGAPFFCVQASEPERVETTGLALDRVEALLAGSKARHKLLVVDAARHVPARENSQRRLGPGAPAADSLSALWSVGSEGTSHEPLGTDTDRRERPIANSVFAHFLLRGLDGDADGNGDGWVTFRELAYHTGSEVALHTKGKQRPLLRWNGDATGDLVLRRAVAALPAAGTAASRVAAWAEVLQQEPDAVAVRDVTMRERIRASGLPWRVRHAQSGIVFVLILSGHFAMGSPVEERDRSPDERQHTRVVDPAFYLGEQEVTRAQWARVMKEAAGADDKLPKVRVSWLGAQQFVQAAGDDLRLPSEAEWEYACRAGAVTAFTFGHTLDPQLANIALRDGGKGGKLKVAGSFATNAWGVFDMHGNAWEWCQDLHDTYVAERGSQPNETSGKKRVLRGGSWRVIAPRCRSANRVSDAPNYSADDVGFRVARAVR